MTLRAGIYARISKDDGTALGVERQIEDCARLAIDKGWRVTERYVDNDVSATRSKARPQYQRMLTDVRAGRLDALLVWDVDRLTRTPRELEDVIDLADAHGLALASVGGEIDLATEQGRLTARLKGSVARYEAEQSSRRIRRKFDERARAGQPHGMVAYGYQRERQVDERGVTVSVDVLHPEQAATIRRAARLILDGHSVRSVTTALNADGVPSPRGKEWEQVTLRQVLLRPRNAGRLVHRGEVIGRGNWPPILSEDDYDRLHALLTDPSRRTARGTPLRHLGSGIYKCGKCKTGATLRVNSGGQWGTKTQPPAYFCPSCFGVRRAEAKVDAVVEATVIARLSMPDGPDLLAGDPRGAADARERVKVLGARLDLAADEYADGKITAQQLERITARLRPQIESAQQALRAAQPMPEAELLRGPDVAEAWKAAPVEAKRAVIDALMTVTLLPQGPGKAFNPKSVEMLPRGGSQT